MSQSPKLLLCVEDDEDDCALIEEAATGVNPRLIFVMKSNGKEALMFLNRQKADGYLPCLILLDMNMPLMDGRQTLVAIKKDTVLQNIPIVIFTTSSSRTDRFFCEQYGVDMVTKPDNISELKKVVSHLVLSRCA